MTPKRNGSRVPKPPLHVWISGHGTSVLTDSEVSPAQAKKQLNKKTWVIFSRSAAFSKHTHIWGGNPTPASRPNSDAQLSVNPSFSENPSLRNRTHTRFGTLTLCWPIMTSTVEGKSQRAVNTDDSPLPPSQTWAHQSFHKQDPVSEFKTVNRT